MPDTVISTSVGSTRYVEFTCSYELTVQKWFASFPVFGFYRPIQEKYRTSVATDSGLSVTDAPNSMYYDNYDVNYSASGVGTRTDQGTTYGPSVFGDYVTLAIPNLGQSIDQADWLTEFSQLWAVSSLTRTNCSGDVGVGTMGEGFLYTGTDANVGAGASSSFYSRWPCPVPGTYPSQVGGTAEHFVSIGRTVCGAGYSDPIYITSSTLTATGWDYPTTAFTLQESKFPYRNPDHNWSTLLYPNWISYLNVAQNSTKTMGFYAAPIPAGVTHTNWSTFNPSTSPFTIVDPVGAVLGTVFTCTFSFKVRVTTSNSRHWILLRTAGTVPPSGSPAYVVSDVYNDIMATAWFGAASGGVKTLYIGLLRGVQKNLGAGITTGYETYAYSTSIDEKSDLGLVFLPSGDLILTFDTYSSGVKTSKYAKHRAFGTGVGGWIAAANVTPNVAQMLSTGRAQMQSMRVRQGA